MSTTVRQGSIRLKVFTCRNGKYARYEFRYTDHHGRRRHIKRSNRADAIAEATRIAKDLAKGHHHAELTLADLASFRAGIVNLYGTGKTLELCTAEYAEAMRLLQSAIRTGKPDFGTQSAIPSLKQLAQFWIDHRPTAITDLTAEAAVAALLETKRQQNVSARWYGALKSQLLRFQKDHPGQIARLTAGAVRQWAYALKGGARTRNNHLAAVKLLFNTGDLRAHRDRQAILDIAPVTVTASTNALWTPGEFQRLLHGASAELLPVLVLGGFAKLRSSEIMRLAWDNVKLSERRLMLHAGQTKTKRWRIVPLPKCAVLWLRSIPRPDGARVWPWGSQKFNADLRALAQTCGFQWRKNALRNSAVTYDQIANPDTERVAREAGNSAAVLETEYFALNGITRRTAKAWFAIKPPPGPKIVRMPLSARGGMKRVVPNRSPNTA